MYKGLPKVGQDTVAGMLLRKGGNARCRLHSD